MKQKILIAGIEELGCDPDSEEGVPWTVEDVTHPPLASESWPTYARGSLKQGEDLDECVEFYVLKWTMTLNRGPKRFTSVVKVPFDVAEKSRALNCGTQIPTYVRATPIVVTDHRTGETARGPDDQIIVRFPEGEEEYFDTCIWSHVDISFQLIDDDSPEVFTTLKDAAAYAKKTPRTLKNWIDDGYLPAEKTGRKYRIKKKDLDERRR